MGNRKPTGRAMSMPGGLALGAGVSLVLTILLEVALTWMVMNGKLAMEMVGYGIMVQLLATSWLGAAVAMHRIKHRKMLVCMLSGLIYLLTLLCITAMFFGGQYEGIPVTALLVLGGSLAAGLVGAGKRGGGRKPLRHKR